MYKRQILGITLVRRANGTVSSIELAGFPHHALDTYLPKLVRAGKRVAICEQLEDPKLTRKVVEKITPNNHTSNKSAKLDISILSSILTEFTEIINKLSTFEEMRVKTQELKSLAIRLGISPRRAFEECYEASQPSLFDKNYGRN